MTDTPIPTELRPAEESELSLFAIASVVVRWRKLIVATGILGGLLGLLMGLTSPRVYMSTATFVPQAADAGASGLALAASQFGIRVPTGSAWGPPVYLALLRTPDLLEPIARDTIEWLEEGRRRAPMMEILRINAPTPELRTDRAVRALSGTISAVEDKKLNAVRISVVTKWPSVSYSVARRLVSGVNEFNLETRKSQAAAERQFAEVQAREAERAMRDAEDHLQAFLQRNRAIGGSPELGFERDRLQRDVALRQAIFTSLLQNREEARLREVRDTPVITVLEEPRLPVVGEPRNSVKKGILGGLLGGALGVLLAFLVEGAAGARRKDSPEAREFFAMLGDATPKFLRRRRS